MNLTIILLYKLKAKTHKNYENVHCTSVIILFINHIKSKYYLFINMSTSVVSVNISR